LWLPLVYLKILICPYLSSKPGVPISTTTRSVCFRLTHAAVLSHIARSHVRYIWQELFPTRLRVGVHDGAYHIHSYTGSHPADPTLPPLQAPQKHSDDTVFYWPRYDSTVHTFLCALHERLIIKHRGKGLGGSSGINFYVFTQPPASDIDGTPCSLWLSFIMNWDFVC
jgi:hypothetical protein